MGQIQFKQFYTELVEHYFRMAVRFSKVNENTPLEWFEFTKAWIEKQSERDKMIIRFVFSYQFLNTIEGLYCFKSKDTLYTKREKLAIIEKRFAIDSGLISGENEPER